MPTTQTSATAGCSCSVASTCDGKTLNPDDLIIRLSREVKKKNPSSSIRPMSPVCSHVRPSGCAWSAAAVAPGLVRTPWTADWKAQHDGVTAIAPMHRAATPEDCAEAVVGLIRNRYTTGHIFVVDGGTSLVV